VGKNRKSESCLCAGSRDHDVPCIIGMAKISNVRIDACGNILHNAWLFFYLFTVIAKMCIMSKVGRTLLFLTYA